MEEISLTPNSSEKNIKISEGNNNYICRIQNIKNFLLISLFIGDNLKYEGNIHISQIQSNLCVYDCNINEILEEINLLNQNSFSLIKESDKMKLKIEFFIFRKKRYLYIDLNLNENSKLNNNETITELKQIIKEKDEKIKSLEKELSKYKSLENTNTTQDDSAYNNFDIKSKEPIHKLTYHTGWIACSTLLKDGRFATGSGDKSIIIFNNKTFKPDLTIKEHNGTIYCLTQLSSGILASCSNDKTIKLFNINGNAYNIVQTLTNHSNSVYKIIELKNKKLVSCSEDNSIILKHKNLPPFHNGKSFLF